MKNIRWFFAEFLVVVTGVLVAFALNSWWLDVKDRNKEENYLKQIISDIEASIQVVQASERFARRSTHAAARLLSYAYSDSFPDQDVLNEYALTAMSYEPGSLIQGTLLSLVNSGDLQLITNDSIRNELITLEGELQDYESLRRHASAQMLLPAFKEFSAEASPYDINLHITSDSIIQIASADSLLPLPEIDHFVRPESPPWRELYSDDEFLAKLNFLYVAHSNLLRAHSGAITDLKEALENIERYSGS
jgi:hypothetical protein